MDVAAGQGRDGGDAVHVDSTEREKGTKDKRELRQRLSPHTRVLTAPVGVGSLVQARTTSSINLTVPVRKMHLVPT